MKRNRIGIIYNPSKEWIGGAYYIQNILSSLHYVDDSEKPEIYVLTDSEQSFVELKNATKYPYLHLVFRGTFYQKLKSFVNNTFFKLSGYRYWCLDKYQIKKYKLAFVYPITNHVPLNYSNSLLAWIPDFQHKYMPHLFSEAEIEYRDAAMKTARNSSCPMVFSSKDAQNDYYKFEPEAKNLSFVLPFTVTHPDFSNENIDEIKKKYNIRGEYLFCANQYWQHKNHKTLFEAFSKAKKQGLELQLVCSGKMSDPRRPEYIEELKNIISQNNLEDEIINVGFIERTEQLCLMNNAYALVQPSLFEGWNTTVEDAKCLNKFIFLSNLGVHIEQAPVNVCYFDPHDVDDLTKKLLKVKPTAYPYDYNRDKIAQGKKWAEIIKSVSNNHLK